MEVTIVGNGKVIINGMELSQSEEITIDRHKPVEMTFFCEKDCRLDSVVYNGKSIENEIQNDKILFPALDENTVLKVVFTDNSVAPTTRDMSYWNIVYFSIALFSLFVCIASIRNKKKTP